LFPDRNLAEVDAGRVQLKGSQQSCLFPAAGDYAGTAIEQQQ
jgi:hypothetical protein